MLLVLKPSLICASSLAKKKKILEADSKYALLFHKCSRKADTQWHSTDHPFLQSSSWDVRHKLWTAVLALNYQPLHHTEPGLTLSRWVSLKMKRQSTDGKKNFQITYLIKNSFKQNIYFKTLNPPQKETTHFKNGQKIWRDTSPKKICGWGISTWGCSKSLGIKEMQTETMMRCITYVLEYLKVKRLAEPDAGENVEELDQSHCWM